MKKPLWVCLSVFVITLKFKKMHFHGSFYIGTDSPKEKSIKFWKRPRSFSAYENLKFSKAIVSMYFQLL